MLDYSDEQIESLIAAIHAGTITNINLPEDFYQATAKYLKTGVKKGIEEAILNIEFGGVNELLVKELNTNIYLFSAAKTFQQTYEMSSFLTTDGKITPLKEFNKLCMHTYSQYNGGTIEDTKYLGYLYSEFNTAHTQAFNAQNWSKFEEEQQLFPFLRRVAVGGELVCPICKELHNICLPINHPFWKENGGASHFNCRCIFEQLTEDVGLKKQTTKETIESGVQAAKVSDTFKYNPGMKKEVFSTTGKSQHPYFQVPAAYKSFAQKNFNLPLF